MNYAWPTVRDKLLVGLSSFSKGQEEEEEEEARRGYPRQKQEGSVLGARGQKHNNVMLHF